MCISWNKYKSRFMFKTEFVIREVPDQNYRQNIKSCRVIDTSTNKQRYFNCIVPLAQRYHVKHKIVFRFFFTVAPCILILSLFFIILSNGCTIKCSKRNVKIYIKINTKCCYMFRFKQTSSGIVAFVLR
jgi:hypothetical protein